MDKMQFYRLIRSEATAKLELLRQAKEIGSSTEAVIDIKIFGPLNFFDPMLARTVCKVSDCFMEYGGFATEPRFELEVRGVTNDPYFSMCPRCMLYVFYVGEARNYDNLCDRCCRVLVNNFPNHDSVPKILAYQTKYVTRSVEE